MTPKFAQHVSPIFVQVLSLLASIDAGHQPRQEEQRQIIKRRLRNADDELRSRGKCWELARDALIYWIDETLGNADKWTGSKAWRERTLEYDLLQTREGSDRFYERSRDAVNLDDRDDAVEVCYICFMLGFRGLYRFEERQKETFDLRVQAMRLPNDPAAWSTSMANIISDRRRTRPSGPEAEPRERGFVLTAKPSWRWEDLLWPWLVAMLLAGICLVGWHQWGPLK